MLQNNWADRGKALKDVRFGRCLPARASQWLRRLKSLAILALFIVPLASAGQRWERWYGGPGDDIGEDVQQTQDGGYVVVGTTQPGQTLWILRLDSLGDTIWTKKYRPSGWADGGTAVAVTPDQGFLVSAFAWGTDTATPLTIYVLRTDSLGDTLWSRFYRFGTGDEEVFRVIATADSNFVLAGYTSSQSYYRALLYKINGSGDTLWVRGYLDSVHGGVIGTNAAETQDHGFMVTGVTGNPYQGYLARTDSQGNLLWTQTYGGDGDNDLNCVAVAPGGFFASGWTCPYGSSVADVWLLRLSNQGDTVWTRTFGGPEEDNGGPVVTTSDGGCVIASQCFSFGHGACDVWLVKTDSLGDTEWTRTFGGSDWDSPYNLRQTRDSGYIVVGSTMSFGSGANDVYLIKTDGRGMVGIETRPASALRTAPLQPKIQAPDPASPGARIRYFLPQSGRARLELFDVTGRRVAALAQEIQSAGWHEVSLGPDLSTGPYFLRLVSGGQAVTRRVVIVSSNERR